MQGWNQNISQMVTHTGEQKKKKKLEMARRQKSQHIYLQEFHLVFLDSPDGKSDSLTLTWYEITPQSHQSPAETEEKKLRQRYLPFPNTHILLSK